MTFRRVDGFAAAVIGNAAGDVIGGGGRVNHVDGEAGVRDVDGVDFPAAAQSAIEVGVPLGAELAPFAEGKLVDEAGGVNGRSVTSKLEGPRSAARL